MRKPRCAHGNRISQGLLEHTRDYPVSIPLFSVPTSASTDNYVPIKFNDCPLFWSVSVCVISSTIERTQLLRVYKLPASTHLPLRSFRIETPKFLQLRAGASSHQRETRIESFFNTANFDFCNRRETQKKENLHDYFSTHVTKFSTVLVLRQSNGPRLRSIKNYIVEIWRDSLTFLLVSTFLFPRFNLILRRKHKY